MLLTRDHLPSHMHAPKALLPEFHAARELMHRYLMESAGRATYYENGARRQEVPHAHLHGFPFEAEVLPEWIGAGALEQVTSWDDVREECEQRGHYYYLGTRQGHFLVRKYSFVLKAVRAQLVSRSEARRDPLTGHIIRGGPNMVEATRQMWRRWLNGTVEPGP